MNRLGESSIPTLAKRRVEPCLAYVTAVPLRQSQHDMTASKTDTSTGLTTDRAAKPRYHGLDLLRLVAIVFVYTHHALEITGLRHFNHVPGNEDLRFGRLGTAAFIVLSGFLAMTMSGTAIVWLRRRIVRLYPSYWIMMGGCFAIVLVLNMSEVTLGQIVSQMLGIGAFTPGYRDNLVNDPTWFMALIIVCYAIAFLAKLLPWPRTVLCVALVAMLYSTFRALHRDWWPLIPPLDTYPHLTSLVPPFVLAALAALTPARGRIGLLLVSGAALISTYFLHTYELVPAGLALCIFAGALWSGWPRLDRAAALAGTIYEFFLVHGVVLVALHKALGQEHRAVTFVAGFVLSVIGAATLRWCGRRGTNLAGCAFRRCCGLHR